jgi:uncharacterized protein (TIGR03437 family)
MRCASWWACALCAPFCLLAASLDSGPAVAQQNILTANYGNARTNADPNETILTPASVSSASFGQLFALSVDGEIYAQPLYLQNVTIPGSGPHNVVFVETMHNSVYAFDADTPAPPLWTVNLGPSVPTANYNSVSPTYTDIVPENGILGTPVIDSSTGTLYTVAATLENGAYIYRLHALDITTGAERFGAPVVVSARVKGSGASSESGEIRFVDGQHIQRPALLLLNGVVYVAFGSHGDGDPYHGWFLGYSAQNVQNQVSVFNATPNGGGGAFWQSGRGPAVDDGGNLYIVSSNGDTDDVTNFANSVLRLTPDAKGVADWFAPFNDQDLDVDDQDLGSPGALLIPGTNLLVTGGKQGIFYVLDESALGHSSANNGQIVQSFNAGGFGIFNMALWNRPDGPILYTQISQAPVSAYKMSGGQFTTSPAAQSVSAYPVPFQGMTLSSNGGQPGTGILWTTEAASWPLPSDGALHAFNADDLSEIWNSDMIAADTLGGFVQFANPTVANGKVYVPTNSNQLAVYGLNGATGAPVPTITGVVNAASYAAGPVSPGEIVAIFGQSLGPANLALTSFDANGHMQTLIAGTQVTFDGLPAPLLYTSNGTTAAIVPYEIGGENTVAFQISRDGQISNPVDLPVVAASPGIFSLDASGSGPGAILNQDYSLNSTANPAQAGSIIVVYGTGGGPTNPAAGDGAITATATPLINNVSVQVGGQPATVLYAGNAGGEVAGVMQINLQLPAGVTGQVPVVVSVGGQVSQATVTVAIQ